MSFEARHPVGLSTHTWSTTRKPNNDGTFHNLITGLQEEVMGDEATTLVDQTGSPYRRYIFTFRLVPLAVMQAFEAFILEIGGDPFEIHEDISCGELTSWTTVKLTAEGLDPEIHRLGGGKFTLVLLVRTLPL